MYSTLLTIHIVGALVTFGVIGSALTILARGQSAHYRAHTIILGALGGFEVLTGVVLSIISPEITALSLCKNVALYLTAVFATEAVLYARMRQSALAFPLRLAFSPVLASLLLMLSAISYGV